MLDARLETVLSLIRAPVHADIGSDHAGLPLELVRRGHIERGVIVELNSGPLENARQAVARAGLGDRLDVRAGDGLDPLAPGEVPSVSLTGLGALTMRGILERGAARQVRPDALVVQPNDNPAPLREWALGAGYHLRAERLASGYWTYPVLRFERADGPDPAYDGLPREAARRYGPLLLHEASALLRQQVHADVTRLTPLAAPGRPAALELATAQAALAWLDGQTSLDAGAER
ncbi:tRNA (adenine(22)-N(1))-methyltransferase TrmK [Deinococcus aquaticus]|uniref:tRNA (Adenine(22)-N(1))-methyltransferase TrmK n=1 Tax=Deinococcus aquaticus TaxID=328692 RepID=A0ABY7V435_9DEIO|nr:tRNA (adenine(22)-N(1))-methyltransferase TrmK [Deinococcus aquaticus]WDA59586.1 tRNA (adenine(22)-N(1))-methyltransferase TrmK [Deinococcus aquaticus]